VLHAAGFGGRGVLAVHYDDSMIAKVLNQQQRRTATGMSFTPVNVASIRKRHAIPARQTASSPDPGADVMSVHQAAAELGITASTFSSAANSAPSTSAPGAGKACVSSYPPPKTAVLAIPSSEGAV
jgi:hypothetical protein